MDPSKVGLLVHTQHMQFKRQPRHQKNTLYMRVNVFSTKVPGEGLPVCRAKVVPSFLSYFKTLSIGPAPGIESATSRSAFERSTRSVLRENTTHTQDGGCVRTHFITVGVR